MTDRKRVQMTFGAASPAGALGPSKVGLHREDASI